MNKQDNQGDSSLHLAINRYVEDPDNYPIYKAILKQILRMGADRKLKNKNNMTAYDLLYMAKDKIYN